MHSETMVKLVEVAPNKWRVERRAGELARSSLPCPNVISDVMDPTEQVDGRYYSSKSAFRAVGKALGLVEVGTEKFRPRQRASARATEKEKRRKSLKLALDKYKEATVPSKSAKQKHFMQAVAHSPEFAAKVDVPQSVGREFYEADKRKARRKSIKKAIRAAQSKN